MPSTDMAPRQNMAICMARRREPDTVVLTAALWPVAEGVASPPLFREASWGWEPSLAGRLRSSRNTTRPTASAKIPCSLKDQLRDTEKRLANLLEAIEQGILTPTTKQRLDELEARKEALNTSILEEELKKPVLTREWIRFWLEKFRKGDVGSTEHQRQIIDTFVNSVYVFDDRVVLNFNFTDDAKTVTREEVLGSSAVDNAPPCKSH